MSKPVIEILPSDIELMKKGLIKMGEKIDHHNNEESKLYNEFYRLTMLIIGGNYEVKIIHKEDDV